MNALPTDDLVRDYLARVDARARFLPADRRQELLGNLAEHIATARAESATDDEATVRTILDRLGEPDQILESESPDDPQPLRPPARPARTEWTGQWTLDGFTAIGTRHRVWARAAPRLPSPPSRVSCTSSARPLGD